MENRLCLDQKSKLYLQLYRNKAFQNPNSDYKAQSLLPSL